MNTDITEILAKYPQEIFDLYHKLRQNIYDSVAGEIGETLWARLPSYYVGERFVRLIPFKDHINIEAAAINSHKDELFGYKITPKGMLQIFIGQDIPHNALIKIFKETLDNELHLSLLDEEWPFEYTDHDRNIVRAIVYDDDGYFYFVRAERDDDFGKATVIETAGGGVEDGENLSEAIKRELMEELGVEVEVMCRIGVVEDYYNFIHRHNINNYYLCRITAFGEKHLTEDEMQRWHLSTLKLTFDEAMAEYEANRDYKLGRLITNREIPLLIRAKEILERK